MPAFALSVDDIRVREVAAHRVAYLVHLGPYWTMGTTLRAVYERGFSGQGPIELAARFASSPLASRSASLLAEVGFAVAPEVAVPDGFQVTERPKELVACIEFEPPAAPSVQDFVRLRQWIGRHGYRSVGPVTEVYTFPPGEESLAPRVELQMSIRPASEPVTTDEPRVGTSRNARTLSASETPPPEPPAQPLVVQVPPTSKPERVSPTAPSAVSAAPGAPSVTPETHEPGAGANDASEAALSPECAAYTSDLLADLSSRPASSRAWLGSALLRVDAIGRALRGMGSVAPGSVAACSSAISREFEVRARLAPQSGSLGKEPSDRTAAGVVERNAVIRELDLLMARLASRRAETGQASDDLAVLFGRIRSILDAERASGAPVDSRVP